MPSLDEISSVDLERKFFFFFYLFAIISPWRKAWPFISINMNPLHPRMLCDVFGRNWPSDSEEEDFKIFSI